MLPPHNRECPDTHREKRSEGRRIPAPSITRHDKRTPLAINRTR